MGTKEEDPLKNQTEKPKKKTFKEKIAYIKENITIEPVLMTYVVPGVLARLATQNLNLDKACRVNLNYGDKVCDALIAKEGTMYQKEELLVQELIASMEAWKNFILTAIPSFLILFIGAWSDRTGNRKICVLLPIVGDLLMCLSNILNAYYFYELPVEVTMFFEALFPAITGGWITTYMGAFSYISEMSSEETRTFRVGVANLCLTAGGPIGTALSGILLKHIGYYGVFTISSLLFCFSICHGFFCIKDPERPKSDKNKVENGVHGFLKSFFDIKHVRDTVTVAFKQGPNRRRLKSILVLSSIAFIYGPAYGEFTVRYLFTRYRFNWDALKYSFYNTFYICIHALGALISISIFSRKWKWGDATLGLISSCSKIVGGLAAGLSRNSTDMYIAVLIETFNATSFTALRSISSKLASTDELGKITSVFNLTEVLTSMIFGPIYSWIYMVSLKIDSGIIYYCSTVLTVPPILIFIWFYKQNKKEMAETKKENLKIKLNKSEDTKPKEEYLATSLDLNDGLYFVE
ncbi:proton-coupled folate transporter-like isoform X1 [Bicyclus anynana]|uniref:Proton-coupled folate transporter-like isoform X1 n=1 Tax=Bicyclus anynana TaxID=110368 RepID=A0A6J1N4X7_BICAN|nr:proton-coupled folate transporter-like isoform X1 [Bicyclus anynana]